jgi:hypothetical protein
MVSSVDFIAPQPGVTNTIVISVLVVVMLWYTMTSVKKYYKYQKIVAQYQKAGMGSIPADLQEKLSTLSGLDPMALGTWVTVCFGGMGAVLITFI